jgi:hypothetical protein
MRSRLLIAIGVVAGAALLTPEQASAQQDVPVTATVGQGRSVSVGDSAHAAGMRGRIPPGWSVRADRANQQFLTVDNQTVGMAVSAGPEGKLNRVHVDASAGTGMTVVIAFYDKIASQPAIDTPETYECRRCGSVLVCSVRPSCEE